MLTPINVEFMFDSACFLSSLGDDWFFRCANILQIADVICQVAFLLFLSCF